MSRRLHPAALCGLTLLLAISLGSCNSSTSTTILASLAVTPSSPSIAKGDTEQFTATGTYSDASTKDLTSTVTWSSGTTSVATISSAGLATAVGVGGPATITATSGSVSGSAKLSVTASPLTSLAVTPASPSIAKGTTEQFTATGTYRDGSTKDVTSSVTWSSGDTTVATVSSAGLATGAGVGGPASITATSGSISGSANLTVTAATLVSLAVTPSSKIIATGTTAQLTATGTYTDDSTQDLTSQVTWSSNTTSVATVSGSGLASGVAIGGPATLTATSGSDSATAQLTVQAPEWTWVGGSDLCAAVSTAAQRDGVYGTLGTAAAANLPGARYNATQWKGSNGKLWLFGGLGYDSADTVGYLDDLWMYDPGASEWTWKGGSDTANPSGVYGTLGTAAAANTPGGREYTVTWTDSSGNLWLFGGYGHDSTGTIGYLNDLWMYSTSTSEWTWKGGSHTANASGVYGTLGTAAAGNVPGAHSEAVAWTDTNDNLWLFGGYGYDKNGSYGALNDLWKYSTSTGEWTWESGSDTVYPTASYGTLGTAAAGNVPGPRYLSMSWIDTSGNLWLFGGGGFDSSNAQGYLNDLWKYSTSTGEWTWESGSDTINASGTYGTEGTAAAANVPGARGTGSTWVDLSGNLWLFGGDGYDSVGTFQALNGAWKYDLGTGEWTWESGNDTARTKGTYGTLGTAASTNVIGARYIAQSWIDANGNVWIFGGEGVDSGGAEQHLHDLWTFGSPP